MHDLIARYGAALVFANVLAASLGLPVPALPTLILVGASIELQGGPVMPALLSTLIVSIAGSLLGDTAWFFAGRRYGNGTLKALCQLSLSRDSCVKQTERFFGRWGVRVLSVAKFIPGLSMISVPLAGAMGVRLPLFLRYDAVGSGLWASVGLVLGVLFAPQLDMLFLMLHQLGTRAAIVIVVVLAFYIAYRWWRRRALLKTLESARISVDELYALMQAAESPVVFDIRSPEKRTIDPYVIPGAHFADERRLDDIASSYDRGTKIVIYCSCPNEISAAWMAKRLRELGFHDVLPLSGGLDAWRDAGWDLTPIVRDSANESVLGVAAKAA
jgi:membrane protein DedA with SNARE-associated domain/rhodanese-related sulfurtransferase